MDVARDPSDSGLDESEDYYSATGRVYGGIMKNPVWLDDSGRTYR